MAGSNEHAAKAGEPGTRDGLARGGAEKSSGDTDVAGALVGIQKAVGNAAATALVQRWKKGLVGGPAPPLSPWVKAAPVGAPPGALKKVPLTPGAAQVTDVDAQVAAGKAAADAAAKAGQAAKGAIAMATQTVNDMGAAKATAATELTTAKTFWQKEDPGSGGSAAKGAANVDAQAKKVIDGAVTVDAQKKVVETSSASVASARAALASASKAAAAVTAKDARGQQAVTAAQAQAAKDLAAALKDLRAERTLVNQAVKDAATATTSAKTLVKQVTPIQVDVWRPLKVGGGPAVIIGRLQQQLNAVGAKPRLSITAQFSDRTKTALVAYQGKGTGLADQATWAKLDAAAPAIKQSGQWVVLSPGGAQPMGTTFIGFGAEMQGLDRPIITNKTATTWWERPVFVKEGPAVAELQQRLGVWVKTRNFFERLMLPAAHVTRTYDKGTQVLVKAFQTASKLVVSGDVDRDTWQALDKLGGKISEGAAVHQELTETEGQERGQVIRYSWKVAGNQLEIRVKIAFNPLDPRSLALVDSPGFPALKKDPKNKAKVDVSEVPKLQTRMKDAIGRWQGDITRVWGGFSAKDVSKGSTAPPVKISFVPEVVTSGGDANVNVTPAATPDNPGARSDAGNFFAVDTSNDLAPHEFGHLIGLPDEYGLREEHFVKVTGTEAQIGSVFAPKFGKTSAVDHARYIASKIKTAGPVANPGDPAPKAVKATFAAARGKATAFNNAVVHLGMDSGYHAGSFHRAVSEAFADDATAKAVSGGKDIPAYIVGLVAGLDTTVEKGQEAVWQIQALYEDPIRPFLSSNSTIMGADATVPAGAGPIGHDHNHPVQARHVQPFAKHIATALGGTWKVS